MLGDGFGAFRSRAHHFFNNNHDVYKAAARVTGIRNQEIALRRGRQHQREVFGDFEHFELTRKMDEAKHIEDLVA